MADCHKDASRPRYCIISGRFSPIISSLLLIHSAHGFAAIHGVEDQSSNPTAVIELVKQFIAGIEKRSFADHETGQAVRGSLAQQIDRLAAHRIVERRSGICE